MRWIIVVLLVLLAVLQFRLWSGKGSLAEVRALRQEIAIQQQALDEMLERNRILAAEVLDLREGVAALEERARSELGMIKDGEIFLQVIDKPPQQAEP